MILIINQQFLTESITVQPQVLTTNHLLLFRILGVFFILYFKIDPVFLTIILAIPTLFHLTNSFLLMIDSLPSINLNKIRLMVPTEQQLTYYQYRVLVLFSLFILFRQCMGERIFLSIQKVFAVNLILKSGNPYFVTNYKFTNQFLYHLKSLKYLNPLSIIMWGLE